MMNSMAEIPGLRPIETPTDSGQATHFFASSPSPKSSSNSPEEFVLPHHSSNGSSGGPGSGTVFRRIRTTLTSPFKSPLAKRVIGGYGGGYGEEENILMQSSSASGGRRGHLNKGNQSCKSTLLAVFGLGAVGLWLLSGSSSSSGSAKAPLLPSQTTFTFRPSPAEGSYSALAVDLFRQAYDSTGDEDKGEEPYIGTNDPLNPGSIFVLLDLEEKSVAQTGESRSNLINRDGEMFGRMQKFNDGLWEHLLESTQSEDSSSPSSSSSALVEMTSFYSLVADHLPHIAGAYFATRDGYTTLMEIKFAIPSQHAQSVDAINAYTRSLVDSIRAYVNRSVPKGVTAQISGLPLFGMDLRPARTRPQLMGASLDDLLPSTAPSLKAYHNLADRFGWGIVSPYKILFDHSDAEKSMDIDSGFRLMHKVMAALAQVDLENETKEEEAEEEFEMIAGLAAVNLDSIPQRIEDGHMNEHLAEVMDELYGVHPIIPDDASEGRRASKPPTRTVYNGVSFLRNNQVPYPLYLGAKICREKQHHHCDLELLHYLTFLTDTMASKDRMTTYISATLGVDPFSRYGIAWLMAARKKIHELEINGDLNGYRVNIVGGASLEYDAWFGAQTVGVGGGKEPPSSPTSSSSHMYRYVVLSASVALLIVGIRSSRSKQSAYDHKKN